MTPRILLTSPADLLAAIPFLLGFHPADSLVAVGFTGPVPTGRLRLTTRWDLPLRAGALGALTPVFRREKAVQAMLAGFGPGPLVTPAMDEALGRLREGGITVVEALRAEGGRYWSYLCHQSACCPPEGRRYDPVSGPVAVQATVGGLVAMPSRDELARSIAPCEGAERRAVRETTARVTAGLRDAVTEAVALSAAAGKAAAARRMSAGAVPMPEAAPGAEAGTPMAPRTANTPGFARRSGRPGRPGESRSPEAPEKRPGVGDEFARAFVAAGLARLRGALQIYALGGRLDVEEAVRLGVDLTVIRVRDEAWTLIDDANHEVNLALWRDLTRRLEPRFVPPVASLLAVTAWRAGDCAIAGLAVERALSIDPGYSMAKLLLQGLQHLLSPEVLRGRLPTSQDLDAQMGPATMAWLLPTLGLLDDPAPPGLPALAC